MTAYILMGIVISLELYLNLNLFKKVEKLEDVVDKQETFITNIKSIIAESNTRLSEIDERGAFSSDDEIGWFFQQLKEIQDNLNNFK